MIQPSGNELHYRTLKLAAAAFFAISFILCTIQVLFLPHGLNILTKDLTAASTVSHSQSSNPGVYALKHMSPLPKHLIPTPTNNRRLLILGDIHGMNSALTKLLKKVRFNPERDHIIAAGDMINKGPNSAAVVSHLMSLNASAVRGNHEDRVLLALAGAQARQSATANENGEPVFDAEGAKGDLKTGRKLSDEHVRWLTQLPLILSIDELDMFVVHAGLVPGVKPEKQDPWAVMNMRTLLYQRPELRRSLAAPDSDSDLDSDSEEVEEDEDEDEEDYIMGDDQLVVPIDTHKGKKWSRAWNQRQSSRSKHARRTVVYGHDARRGLTLGKYTFGLDSGCVAKGQLTAMIVEADGEEGAWKSKIEQVNCKKLRK